MWAEKSGGQFTHYLSLFDGKQCDNDDYDNRRHDGTMARLITNKENKKTTPGMTNAVSQETEKALFESRKQYHQESTLFSCLAFNAT